MTDHGIAVAKKAAGWMPGAGKELKRLPSLLGADEEVLGFAPGKYAGSLGLVVATDARVIVMASKMFGQTTEDVPYSKLSSVGWSEKFATGKLSLAGSGVNLEVDEVASVSGQKLVTLIRSKVG